MQVLIVDDDESVRQVLAEMLRSWGYEAWYVEHGRAALDYLSDAENQTPELIILDYMMPVMNGEEFLTHREQDCRLKTIPVVMFSGTINMIRGPAAEGYVQKPYLNDVRKFVEKYCARRPT